METLVYISDQFPPPPNSPGWLESANFVCVEARALDEVALEGEFALPAALLFDLRGTDAGDAESLGGRGWDPRFAGVPWVALARADVALVEACLRAGARDVVLETDPAPLVRRRLHTVVEERALAHSNGWALDEGARQFIQHVSHALRSPAGTIVGYAELLRDEGASCLSCPRHDDYVVRHDTQQYADAIYRNGLYLTRAIENLFAAASIGRDLLVAIPRELDLEQFLSHQLTPYERLASSRGLRFACAMECDAATALLTDADLLSGALTRLIDNALAYTQRGEIGVRVFGDGEYVVFEVCDTGCGIAGAQLGLLNADTGPGAAPRPTEGSLGLGLYVARRFACELGGTISIESVAGSGTQSRMRVRSRLDVVGRAGG